MLPGMGLQDVIREELEPSVNKSTLEILGFQSA